MKDGSFVISGGKKDMKKIDAIVLSGGIPKPDTPLYEYTQGKPKALLDVCGKPMIQWVLDALEGAETINQIVIVGLTDESAVTCSKVSAFIPSLGDMMENGRAGLKKVLELNPKAHHVLAASSDIPAIKPAIVDWVVNTTSETDDDIYYNLITRQVMEARFPGSNRSFTKLKDVEVCGGDMNVVSAQTITENDELFKKVLAARKNVFKQAALIGYDTLFLLLLRRIDTKGAVEKVTKKLNITGRAILCPYAEVGMDVDKPHQLEILRADLSKQESA